MNDRSAFSGSLLGIVEAAAVFWFLYQALRTLFSVFFGLMYDSVFAGSASLAGVAIVLALIVVALLVPLFASRPARHQAAMFVAAVVVFLARIVMTFGEPRVRLAAALLIVAGAGFYLAAALHHEQHIVTRGLLVALLVDGLVRTLGHTFDPTLQPAWWPAQAGLSVVLCLLAGRRSAGRPPERVMLGPERAGRVPADAIVLAADPGLLGGLAWGAWLFLETSLLAFPNAVARWTAGPYPLFAGILPFLLALAIGEQDQIKARLGRVDVAFLTVVLLVGVGLGYLVPGVVAAIGLASALFAALMLLPAVLHPAGAARRGRAGLGLAIGGVLFLVLNFAYAFTFTYPYTLDAFRGMALPLFLLAGLVVGLPALRLPRLLEPAPRPSRLRLLGSLAAGAGLMVLAFLVAMPPPRPLHRQSDRLRAVTYNIHYGYDDGWRLQLEAQAQAIEAADADVVMLQEVDTGRPTSYMIDDALWLARRLGMNAVYLPTLERLSGIALLSRYPVLDSELLLLPSALEQTGIIWAGLDMDGAPLNAFATWLGLEPEERASQLDAALPFAAAHPGPAVFGGDLNSTPDSPVYAGLRQAGWIDPFDALGLGSPPTSPAVGPGKRIDYVWLRDLKPVTAEVGKSLASDHRPVGVEAMPPAAAEE